MNTDRPYLPDVAYLLLTEHDVTAHPDLPPGLSDALTENLYSTAGLYASISGCAHTYNRISDNRPSLVNQTDLLYVLRHARTTVADAFTDGWLPKDATAPF